MPGKTKYFSPRKIKEGKATPPRIYMNRFLIEELERILSNKEISVLDIGCGSGYIRKMLYELGYRINYTGLDVSQHKDFEKYKQYSSRSKFIKSKIEDFKTEKKFDLVFSMCALEHIENDKLAVNKSRQLMKEGGTQIHIVPSKYSFWLYWKHGYRRYNPARLRKIFGDEIEIYRIGGFFSFLIHFFLITIPKKIFKITKLIEFKIYLKTVKMVNVLDKLLPIFPSIYIIINSKPNKNETTRL